MDAKFVKEHKTFIGDLAKLDSQIEQAVQFSKNKVSYPNNVSILHVQEQLMHTQQYIRSIIMRESTLYREQSEP